MTAIRRYHVLITLLILTSVCSQVLDVGLCCTQSTPAPSPTETLSWVGDADSPSGPIRASVPDVPAAPDDTRSPDAQVDCFCHLVFTMPDPTPAKAYAVVSTSLHAEAPERPSSVILSTPGPVPIVQSPVA
ncbi:MAG: hypothetical protein GVY15_06155 [Bacteroidetes bacterium]|jgi:hypothetical protein|nr:hypothetical protein [Bacteroidota bacterium]